MWSGRYHVTKEASRFILSVEAPGLHNSGSVRRPLWEGRAWRSLLAGHRRAVRAALDSRWTRGDTAAMRRKSGFAILVILTLAVGIGVNTAIFSLLDAMLLRPLAVPHPEQLVQVGSGSNGEFASSYAVWEQIRDRHLFAGAFAWSFNRFNTSPSGRADYIDGFWASGQIFDVLGIHAILGRTLTLADDHRGGGPDGPVADIATRSGSAASAAHVMSSGVP